jgi:hypothetical protein
MSGRGVIWTERFPNGWLSTVQTDFNQAMLEGRRDGRTIRAQLTLEIDDVDAFVAATTKVANVRDGFIECPELGGRLEVADGEFALFVPSSELLDYLHLRMRYRLRLTRTDQSPLLLYGFKMIEDDPGSDIWADTTTLFVRIHELQPGEDGAAARDNGAPAPIPAEPEGAVRATGVMQITPGAFLHQLTTFTGTAGSLRERLRAIARYGWCFFGEGLARVYFGAPSTDPRPSFPQDVRPVPWAAPRPAPNWEAVPGRASGDGGRRLALEREVIPFRVDDLEFPLNLHHVRKAGDEPHGEPVLLVPGSGVRAELYYGQPVGETIVDRLLHEGYDVWVENWRASIDFPNNSYTLDRAARHDHPRAVELVAGATGQRLRTIVHCQGSIGFLLSAIEGRLENHVSHIVSSAISLFFEVPYMTWLKQRTVLQLARRIGRGCDAQWGIRAPSPVASTIAALSRLTERPCNNGPCQIANFMYGSGWDVLLLHDNVDDRVHAWSARELGYTPFSLIQQVAESCRYGHIVPADSVDVGAWPSYVASRPELADDVRLTFIGGTHNRMFHPQGQKRSAEFLAAFGYRAGFVPLVGYGHLDTFWGRDAADYVWPIILDGLDSGPGNITSQIRDIPADRPTRFGVSRPDRRWRRDSFSMPPATLPRYSPRFARGFGAERLADEPLPGGEPAGDNPPEDASTPANPS